MASRVQGVKQRGRGVNSAEGAPPSTSPSAADREHAHRDLRPTSALAAENDSRVMLHLSNAVAVAGGGA